MYIPESSELGEEIEGLHHLYQSQPVAKDKALFHFWSYFCFFHVYFILFFIEL